MGDDAIPFPLAIARGLSARRLLIAMAVRIPSSVKVA
jgi:hypothetical protein